MATAFIGLPNIDFSTDEKKGARKREVQVGAEGATGATVAAGGGAFRIKKCSNLSNPKFLH